MLLTSPAVAIEQITVSGLGVKKNMQADFILPDGEGPFPGVLVLHTSGGVQQGDIQFARELAKQGYACLVPYYFDAHGITAKTRPLATTKYAEEIFSDLVDALRYLKKNQKVNKDKLSAVGFSMGGYWALILAAKGSVLAGVSYYGALSGGGKGLDLKYRFEDIFTKDSSPVLILHGDNDTVVPVILANQLSAILNATKTLYEMKIYSGVGHRYDRQGSLDENAANDSWDSTLVFLKKHLK